MPPEQDLRSWGVLLKVALSPDAIPPEQATLAQLLAALPGADKKLTGGGHDFTLAWWVEASDAAAATTTAADTLRAAAASLGMGRLRFVRSHAASVEGRAPTLDALAEAADDSTAWAMEVKAAMPTGGAPASPESLADLRAALRHPHGRASLHGDVEKFLLDDGSGITVRLWARGETMEEALTMARDAVADALEAAGLEDWALVRVKAWAAQALRGDIFPGAHERQPMPTGELR